MERKRTEDAPASLLAYALRWTRRPEWGAAMLAELAHVDGKAARWRFALGCARAALLTPRREGPSNQMSNALTSRLTAAVLATALVAPFAFLQVRNSGGLYPSFPYPLFALMWALAAAFVVAAAPLVRTLRAGTAAIAHPAALGIRIALLAAIALFWIALVRDQMPCFLGVPNCD